MRNPDVGWEECLVKDFAGICTREMRRLGYRFETLGHRCAMDWEIVDGLVKGGRGVWVEWGGGEHILHGACVGNGKGAILDNESQQES